ncbi:polymerase delta-interacting protein 2-like isoform X1 [Rhodnius prolixus]
MATNIFFKNILQGSLLSNLTISLVQVKFAARLIDVGRLEPPKNAGNYKTGQLFLHKVLAYRGVVLFPWIAKMFDRDYPVLEKKTSESSTNITTDASQSTTGASSSKPSTKSSAYTPPTSEEKAVKGRSHTFYQVLIDSRDCPFIRMQTDAVTFLGNQEGSRSLYSIPGLDYVSHDDILPYSTKEKNPLHHELFDKFFIPAPTQEPPYTAQDTLKAWQKKNHPWLELSDVHKETTDGVRITVIPFYMGSRDSQNSLIYWWRYCIRMENLGTKTVQMREHHWRIFSLSGTLETVRGRGVIGLEPILSPTTPVFQYSSHVSLQAPSGHMWGTFRMEREDGYTFDCRIPPFSLESKTDEENTNPPTFGA